MSDIAQQAEAKAESKVEADHKVATEPHAIHGVMTMFKSPAMAASIVTGAGIGALYGGPVGAVVGGVIGGVVERKRILGGPVGILIRKIRGH